MLGPEFVPAVVEGYFSTVQKPLDVFRCRIVDLCPGGIPGTCAGGLKGEPCAVCPAGQTWSRKTCADCGSTALAWVAAAAAALMALYAAYFLVNLEVTGSGGRCPSYAVQNCLYAQWLGNLCATNSGSFWG
eukprot:s2564_g28.t1